MTRPYSDYLTVNREFVPVFSVQADREHPEHWRTFQPNDTFTAVLSDLIGSLEADTSEKRRSLWISGAYGTGKSFAAFTLKHLLEDDIESARSYFSMYQLSSSLLNRLESAKSASNVLVVYRSSSSGITGENRLLIAIQESIKTALKERGYKYLGEKALYDRILDTLKNAEGAFNFRAVFNGNRSKFTDYSSPDEVVKDIEDLGADNCLDLLETIVEVAEASGFTFGNNIETVTRWIRDIVSGNSVKIVFIWDEFTEYFQKNPNSTSGLQELAHSSFEIPFYFLLITHKRLEQFIYDSDSRRKLEARFKMHKLEMGTKTAFMLMRGAVQVVPELRTEWDSVSSNLWFSVEKVVSDILTRYDDAFKRDDIRGLLPLHPFAAFILQILAREVNSNQRTMFQFLCGDPGEAGVSKPNFRWFIENTNLASWPYLTADYVWDYFFFEDNVDLDDKSRAAINFYNTFKSQCANDEQIRVLKVALLLTAMGGERGRGISSLLRPTLSNISAAFAGTPISDDIRSFMDRLVKKSVFGTISEADDVLYISQAQNIDEEKYKEKELIVRKSYDFEKLLSVPEYQLTRGFDLTGYAVSRFATINASHRNLRQKLHDFGVSDGNRLPLVFLFAKDEEDASKNQEAIAATLRDYGHNIVLADVSSQTLGGDEYEAFVKHATLGEYHKSSRPEQAALSFKAAKEVIDTWSRRINESARIVLHSQRGEMPLSFIGAGQFASRLAEVDRKVFPYALESMTANDSLFKSSFTEVVALLGMGKQKIVPPNYAYLNTFIRKLAEDNIWTNPNYASAMPNHPLSKMKQTVEIVINDGFAARSSVGIAEIWAQLKAKPFGLVNCTGSALVLGFLLKEYADSGYYKKDGIKNPSSLTAAELANMIVAIIKGLRNADTLSIVRMTETQERFCRCSGTIFGLSDEQQSSIQGVMIGIKASLDKIGFPLWALAYYVRDNDAHNLRDTVQELVSLYCGFISTNKGYSKDETRIAEEISVVFAENPGIQVYLREILNSGNLRKGLDSYISESKPDLPALAYKLNLGGNYISHVRSKFTDFSSWLWDKSETDSQIAVVFFEYQLIDAINGVLIRPVRSMDEAANAIRTKVSALKMPYEMFRHEAAGLEDLLSPMLEIYRTGSLRNVNIGGLYDQLLQHTQELKAFESRQQEIFGNRMSELIGVGLSEPERAYLFSRAPSNSVNTDLEEYVQKLRIEYTQYKRTQKYGQLRETWERLSGFDTPAAWSQQNTIPILCLFSDSVQAMRETFDLINAGYNGSLSDSKIDSAIRSLTDESTAWRLSDVDYREAAFKSFVLGEYEPLFSDAETIKRLLLERLGSSVYDWFFQKSQIDQIVRVCAEREYKREYVARVLKRIDTLEDQRAKDYLKELIKQEPLVGIQIMKEEKR